MRKNKLHRRRNKGFSLIEVSVVILIIGLIIASIFAANALIKKARIQSAQALTKSSPIVGIYSTALWLESSLENSFADSENNDGASISTWNDQSSNSNKSTISQVGAGPVYANTINYVHAVKFSGSTADYLKIAEASYLNDTDYTIVVLEKRQSASAGFFLSTTNSSDVADNKLELGYASDGVIAHNHNSTNYAVAPKVSTYSDSTDKARLFTFVQDSAGGKKTYINGILAAQDVANTSQLSGVKTLAIGKGYTGEIGEIAIFTKVLSNEERKTVEDYLGKKWTRKLNRSSANTAITGGVDSNPTCLNGIVTESGCDNACSTAVVTGISTPTQVKDGASGTLTCNSAAGYSGSVTYNCSNGNLNPVGSCAVTTCSITGVTGFNDKSGLAYSASPTAISSPCQAGYTGSPTYTCTTMGAASISGSCAPITCSISGVVGFNDQNVPYATSTTTIPSPCQAGYVGSPTPTYTCTAAGPATISGNCVNATCSITGITGFNDKANLGYAASPTAIPSPCQAGYTGSPTYTCTTSGAATISGSCAPITCSITGVTGFNNATDLSYAASPTAIPSPCQAGYTGSPTYTCTTSGAATVSGSCAPITCTMAAGTGYTAKTGLAYAAAGSGSFSCDVAGYSGTINYTCTSSGAATNITSNCSVPPCTGGTIDTTTVPGSTIHKFTSTGTSTLTCPSARSIQVLVVGGGGAGGGHSQSNKCNGGGGAGRVIKITNFTTGSSSTSYTVTVGNGGTSVANGNPVTSGEQSSFTGTGINLVAPGGGAGGGFIAPSSGGSGGGGAAGNGGTGSSALSGTISGTMTTVINAGNSGGSNGGSNPNQCNINGGGGGGAGSAGSTGSGGLGISDNITGSSIFYAAGGGPGAWGGNSASGIGGKGIVAGVSAATAGAENTGSGGGAGESNSKSGAGGSGVVIVRY